MWLNGAHCLAYFGPYEPVEIKQAPPGALDNAWNFATGLVMTTAAVVAAAPAIVEGAIASAETAMLKATVARVNSAICATLFGLGGAAGTEAASQADSLPEIESVNAASTEPVQPYEVSQVNDLRARSVVGDGLDIHHIPQAHPAEQVIPGYARGTGPGIALPEAEHGAVNALNITGVYGGTARDLVARNLWALHQLTGAPNGALQDLLSLIRTMYSGVLNKR